VRKRAGFLQQAHAEAEAALKLAPDNTATRSEAVLTQLWTDAACVLERLSVLDARKSAANRPPHPPQAKQDDFQRVDQALSAMEAAMRALPEAAPEAVLRAAARAAAGSEDPVLLAGAADVISVVAGASGKDDPIGKHVASVMNGRYLPNAETFNFELAVAAREAAGQRYLEARDTRSPDPEKTPSVCALQLYRAALEKDERFLLPRLRTRLYLLERPFDPERAEALLTDLSAHEPKNAVVPFERARAAALLDQKPDEALRLLREGARMPRFSRSYLVAVPAPLRRTLSGYPPVRAWVEKGWPGYQWLYATLDDTLNAQTTEAGRMEVRQLRLAIAEHLSQAEDYPDQALGIHRTTLCLLELLKLADLAPEQRARFEARLAQHFRVSATFPGDRRTLTLTGQGMTFDDYPKRNGVEPRMGFPTLFPNGSIVW
jgi:hypothetical protein